MTLSRMIRILRHRLRAIVRKEELDAQLDRELEFHFEQLVEEKIADGLPPAEARREAARALGHVPLLQEQCRDQRRVGWFEDLTQDVRYALRIFRRNRGFTAVAVLSLALGIGANTAVLGAALSLVFGDLHLPDTGKLVLLLTIPPGGSPASAGSATVPEFMAWKEQTTAFEAMGASVSVQQDFGADENGHPAERVIGHVVTPSLFAALRVQPVLGRVFADAEAQMGSGADVIVVSYGLWQRRLGGDPEILNKPVLVNGRKLRVIGVMPAGFWYPHPSSQYWMPLVFNPYQLKGSARLFQVTARLRDGYTLQQAQAELDRISARLSRRLPERYEGWTALPVPVRAAWFGWAVYPLALVGVAVSLVLLIACANVATLLLARATARRPELAMRMIMGAGRGRIVRQLVTESMVLSLSGGMCGLLIAWWGIRTLSGITPPPGRMAIAGIPPLGAMIALTVLISLGATLFFGVLPAFYGISKDGAWRSAESRVRRRRTSGALVSVQIALALVLLIDSGLLVNSFVRLMFEERGFDARNLLMFEYRIPAQDFLRPYGSYQGLPIAEARPPTQMMQRMFERLRQVPGTESIGGSSVAPMTSLLLPMSTIRLEGRTLPAGQAEEGKVSALHFLVTPGFFQALRTPIVRGRDFDGRDSASSPWVAVINETMARRLWPGEDPIGKRFTVDAVAGERPREVVGVVRDMSLRYVQARPSEPVLYTLRFQQEDLYRGFNANSFGQLTFFIRTYGDPLGVLPAVRDAAAEVDPLRPLANVTTMEQVAEQGLSNRRYYVIVFGTFAAVATILAAIGIYGVTAHAVGQRTREIGMRKALGATTLDIVYLIGRDALKLIAAGVVVGLGGAIVTTRIIADQLWSIGPQDPLTFAAVTLLLAAIALVACLAPTRRAIQVDPASAIRTE